MSTHQQLLYHIVFSTKNRKPYLENPDHRAHVFAYMAGVAKNLDGFALDHIFAKAIVSPFQG